MAKKYHTPLSEQAENQTSNEPNGHIFPSNGENLVPPTTPQRGQNSNPRPDSDRRKYFLMFEQKCVSFSCWLYSRFMNFFCIHTHTHKHLVLFI